MIFLPLSSFDNRKSSISMVVIHSTAFDMDKAVATYKEYDVAPHYIIDENGEIINTVNECDRAWHSAKTGCWRDIKADINSSSIGIELLHHNLGQTEFSEKQISSSISLIKKIIDTYNISPKNIVGHSDIDPIRKSDPGKCFPWEKLAKFDIGLWYNIDNANKISNNDISAMLNEIGYSTDNITATCYAFCRRFKPELIGEFNLEYLLEKPYPNDFKVADNPIFINTLKSVYYSYTTCTI